MPKPRLLIGLVAFLLLLGQVSPAFASNETANAGWMDAEFTSQGRLSDIAIGISSEDSENQIFSKYRMAVVLTLGSGYPHDGPSLGDRWLSPFIDHIGRVVGNGSDPKVTESRAGDTSDDIDPRLVISDATSNITGMANQETARREGAGSQFPSDMSSKALILSATGATGAVPASIQTGSPQPAPIGFIDFRPEAISEFGALTEPTTHIAAILGSSVLKLGARHGKVRTTMAADTLNLERQSGNIYLHPEPPTLGAVSPAVDAARGLCVA